MSVAKTTFELNGVTYSLYFGMASARVFEEKAIDDYVKLVASGIEEPEDHHYDTIKGFANIIHAGLCNQADVDEVQRPKFASSYELAEQMTLDNASLVIEVFEIWNQSRPVKDMLERMQAIKEANESQKKKPEIQDWDEIEAYAFGQLGITPSDFLRMTYRQYVNMCVGYKDKILREDRFNRDLLYNIIKGWADPKQFKMSKEKFWPLYGDEEIQVIIPTREELILLDQKFRSFGRKQKWLE